MTVHSRRAEKEVISLIGNRFPGKVILHWYSGSISDLEKAVSYGFYFSVNSAMIQSQNGINIIKNIPNERLLLESDSPFIGVNRESLIPVDLNSTIREIAKIKDSTEQNLKDKLKNNFKDLII